MRWFRALALPAVAAFSLAASAQAQSAPNAAPRSQVAGVVADVDAAGNQFSVRTDAGETVSVSTTERTILLHLPPGETDVHKGTRMALSGLAVGDRVVAVYRGPADQKTVQATSVLVRTSADLAQVAKAEQDDWRKRGATGTVTALDSAAAAITLKVGQRTITVQTSDKTDYHRYSLDSARFSDSRPSAFGEIKIGDQVRVLGNKSEDGTAIKAERIVSGAFRQIAATIISIDAANSELKVTDLATKKPLTIRVNADSTMKKLDPAMAAGLARRYGGGRGPGPADAAAAAGGRGGGGGDIGQLLDRLAAMPLSELKPHDAVMVSTTMGSDPSHVTIITLLAGVEPILTAAPNATRDIMSGWNLGAGAAGDGQ